MKVRIIVAVLLGVCGIGIYMLSSDRVMPWNKQQAIATALEWGGLHALPVQDSDVDVRTEGSMFSRTFVLRFESDSATVSRWIKNNPSLQSTRNKVKGTKNVYKIYPGRNGAMGGTVTISGRLVKIRMSWS